MCPPPVCCAPSIDSVLGSRPQQGTFGYRPRDIEYFGISELSEIPRVSEWPRIPDSELPEPWSCEWGAFIDSLDWYEEPQPDLVEAYGHALAGFVPALFVYMDDHHGDTLLCPPGGAGPYYLWANEARSESLTRRASAMQRFHGVFASLEHFVCTADWNRLEGVVPLH
jgi:hypothetical protein